jgi:hypothetical protein
MDLATLVFITVCGGHCKKVEVPPDYIGVPTLAACRASIGRPGAKLVSKSEDADYLADYTLCVPMSPRLVRSRWTKIYESNWWERERSKEITAKAAD